MTKAYNWIHIR